MSVAQNFNPDGSDPLRQIGELWWVCPEEHM